MCMCVCEAMECDMERRMLGSGETGARIQLVSLNMKQIMDLRQISSYNSLQMRR